MAKMKNSTLALPKDPITRRLQQSTVRIFTATFFVILSSTTIVSAEVIRQFNADIKLNSDCSLDVTEVIKMDFENSKRHGIFRIIPVVYSRYGGNYTLDLQLLSVSDEHNQALSYQARRMGSDFHIKIGEPDILITGRRIYCLHYTVRRAVNFFDSKPEVYWNATGNDWPFGIEEANVRFYPPTDIGTNEIRANCFIGQTGSTTQGQFSNRDKYILFQATNIEPGSGLTIVTQLPPNAVNKPALWQEIIWFLKDWWGLIVFPLGTGAYLIPVLLQRTRDPLGSSAIAVEWNPPKDLSPAEVGTLIDESCDMQDIISTLVDLAARGFLQIKELKSATFLFFSNTDYEFTRMNSFKDGDILLPHEQKFLNALFAHNEASVKLSDLKEKFYVNLPYIRQAIYQSLTDKKLFFENPETVRMRWTLAAIGVGTAGILYAACLSLPNHTSIGIGLVISAAIVLIAAKFMPARTATGWKERAQCLGFQRFVRLAEKDRIAVLAKEDPTIFGRLLPFAMVLGAADQWAEAFHGLLSQPPSWYIPYGYGTADYTFSSRNFVHDLGNGMNTMAQLFPQYQLLLRHLLAVVAVDFLVVLVVADLAAVVVDLGRFLSIFLANIPKRLILPYRDFGIARTKRSVIN